jgi:hypothetical protein
MGLDYLPGACLSISLHELKQQEVLSRNQAEYDVLILDFTASRAVSKNKPFLYALAHLRWSVTETNRFKAWD